MKDLLTQFDEIADKIEAEIKRRKRAIERKRAGLEEIEMFSHYSSDHVDAFFKKPYVILPRKKEEWYLIVPKLFDLNVGYLTKSTDSYNVFIVNKYADYLSAVPAEFKSIFKFKPKIPLKIFDGVLLTGEEHQDTAWDRYRKFLTARKGNDRITVKRGQQFDLIAKLIDDGILPFIPQPVNSDYLVDSKWHLDKIEDPDDRKNVAKRLSMDFFKDAVNKFMETGAVGIYWAMGTGKTLFGLELLSRIKVDDRPNLVISGKSALLRQQWTESLKLIEPAAPVVVETYQSLHKVKDKKWGIEIIDECHHLPANIFSRAATIDTMYRAGLCLAYYTKIYTEFGVKRIIDVVNEVRSGKDIQVWSYNHESGTCELKPVIGVHEQKAYELFRVKIMTKWGEKKIVCTPEHRFFVEGRGYIQAKDLREDDEVFILQQPPMTQEQKNAKSEEVKRYYETHDIWNKGLTKESDERILQYVSKGAETKRGKHYSPSTEFKNGHKLWHDEELTQKRIETIKESGCLNGANNGMFGMSGELNPNWRGGVSYWRKEFYNSIPYKEFRSAVLLRDNYTCQKCGGRERGLHIHHIQPFADYPELRLDVNNGIALCFNLSYGGTH